MNNYSNYNRAKMARITRNCNRTSKRLERAGDGFTTIFFLIVLFTIIFGCMGLL